MKRVTLNGINRVGLKHWRAREWWWRQQVRIWSAEHAAWWRPLGHGYSIKDQNAGIWSFPAAYAMTKHCGPEKRIAYYALPDGDRT